MWANTLSHKRSLTSGQHKTVSCKGKEPLAKDEKVSIPDSWDLSDNQRLFIESFLDPKNK
ncbi:hypothetical protein BZ160_01035 [Pantoea vagans]|jgi:hypothetical protein|nr:hypothetical protein D0A61_09040 [Pantoea agglomerans]MBB1226151.1 hypothetical protein [Pantoea pleuroti]OQV42740.1 hypothetical protein BZ160_01035 [Pantoea vagans]RNA78892.1 hypothetical protein EBO33_02395 [[Curtobacterium] plantarum]RZK06686.1 MAG: hypothetical protein EOO84_13025 [Pantoea sp.]TSH84864.1 hypothetical protein FOV68_02285 [Pantoea sp. paga]